MARQTADIPSVKSILAEFNSLEDPRSPINRRHLLGDILVISILAVIAGADGPKAIGVWAASNEAWLRKRLKLLAGVPAHKAASPYGDSQCTVSANN